MCSNTEKAITYIGIAIATVLILSLTLYANDSIGTAKGSIEKNARFSRKKVNARKHNVFRRDRDTRENLKHGVLCFRARIFALPGLGLILRETSLRYSRQAP